jgi:hypothetical protein
LAIEKTPFLAVAGVGAILLGVAIASDNAPALDPENFADTENQFVKSSGPIPDLSADGISWRLVGGTQFNKVPGDPGPGPIVNHPDYVYEHGDVNRVPDITNPILQPQIRARMEVEQKRVMAGGLPFVPTSRCWPGGVPGLHVYPAQVVYLQTPKQVVILNGRGEFRHVYMDVPHSVGPDFSWYGESVGHYENGDTLVIDTIGLDALGPIDRYNTPHSKQMQVIESHTVAPDASKVTVTFTVDDPGTFTMAWQGQVVNERARERDASGNQVPMQWTEYSCNENSEEFFIPPEELVPVPHDDVRDF